MNDNESILRRIESVDTGLDPIEYINTLMSVIYANHPFKHNPVSCVRYIPLKKIHANTYNPNNVAKQEMKLLHTSVAEDGYTMPIVTYYDADKDEYIIVDGFHRYSICMYYEDIHKLNHGYIPVVVIEKDLADRMASTVRHNRARGKHAIEGMSNIVLQMLKEGKTDYEVCMELGLEADELIKLKHITGFAKLFEGAKYSNSWESNNQIMNRLKHSKMEEEPYENNEN